MDIPRWNDRDERGRHWNGQRWVPDREWSIAHRIVAFGKWSSLPWYKKLFTKNPHKEN